MPVIQLQNIGKAYQTHATPIHRLLDALRRNSAATAETFWALRNIDLEVEVGETLGIIGKNGCGKSTLLQIITGTLVASTGTVATRGRISAILELGAGFNPEFTGMENARLNASIIGMSGAEIESRLDAIVEFSGLEEFIRQPVKNYSSGMYIRLAFSICINMQPDILIIDEALAVGDARFQRKCFRKIEELRNAGTTILFVTHATDSVIALCDRALLLDAGRIKTLGDPKTTVNRYLESVFMTEVPSAAGAPTRIASPEAPANTVLNTDIAKDGCRLRATYNSSEYRWGNRAALITDYLLTDADGVEVITGCGEGDKLKLSVAISFSQDIAALIYGFTVKTIDGALVFGTNSELLGLEISDKHAGEIEIIEIDFHARLVAGDYFVSLGVVQPAAGPEVVLDRRYDLFLLRVNAVKQTSFGVAALDAVMQHKAAAT